MSTAVTDARGIAFSSGLHPGIRYRLEPTAEGYRELGTSYLPRLELGAPPMEIGLAPERLRVAPTPPTGDLRSLEVRVADAHGEPLSGARVMARDAGNRPLGEGGVTDGAGSELPASLFAPGASLRVELTTPAGQVPPRIYVNARSLHGPSYYRDLNSRGESEVILRGLGAGRFAVRVSPIQAAPWEREFEVELDGRSELRVNLSPP